MISTLWHSVTSTLAGLPGSDLAAEPASWLVVFGGGLLIAANVWMWLLPVARPSFAGVGTSDSSLRGGLTCSSISLVLLGGGLIWSLFL